MFAPRPVPPLVAFLSDYGHQDEFVGVCKAVVLGLAPEARIVDVTHEIAPFDVRGGALALVRAVQYLPEGAVVLAIVDPGVGTDRRLVAVDCGVVRFVGPDNGLLAPAVAMVGGATRAVVLDDEEAQLPAPGPTFAGRDVMAPAVGRLAAGVPLESLGSAVDPVGLVPGLLGLPREGSRGELEGEVWWIDRFGNCQLNIGPEELWERGVGPGGSLEVRLPGGAARRARWVRTYSEARPAELVLLVDSYGLCALVLDRASAARECGLAAGSAVTIVAPGAPVPGLEVTT